MKTKNETKPGPALLQIKKSGWKEHLELLAALLILLVLLTLEYGFNLHLPIGILLQGHRYK